MQLHNFTRLGLRTFQLATCLGCQLIKQQVFRLLGGSNTGTVTIYLQRFAGFQINKLLEWDMMICEIFSRTRLS